MNRLKVLCFGSTSFNGSNEDVFLIQRFRIFVPLTRQDTRREAGDKACKHTSSANFGKEAQNKQCDPLNSLNCMEMKLAGPKEFFLGRLKGRSARAESKRKRVNERENL